MSDSTHNPDRDPDSTPTGRDEGRHIPSADQDVASGQPYDPREDPGTDPTGGGDDDSAGGGDDDSAEGGDDDSAGGGDDDSATDE